MRDDSGVSPGVDLSSYRGSKSVVICNIIDPYSHTHTSKNRHMAGFWILILLSSLHLPIVLFLSQAVPLALLAVNVWVG